MHRHGLTWIALFGVITLMFLQLPPMAARQDAVLNTYGALVEVNALVKQRFVKAIADDRLVNGAIRGVLFQLDPYCGYITPAELPAFERRARGDYIGIGVEVGMQSGKLTVIAPIEGSPAAGAGLLAGDAVLAIDGRAIEDLSVFDVEDMLVGSPGTTVRLRIQHQGQSDTRTVTITRGPVSLISVRGFRRDASARYEYMIDAAQRIGYIRVSNFLQNTTRDFDAVLARLLEEAARGLIIDLRFNPGGVMHQAIAMVDRFVGTGVILSTVTRRKAVHEYLATPHSTDTDVKLVVLINGASASAAEIVAGSLQASGRALVVGERSFGKGSVQHLIYLTETEGAVKLTTAYYRLPDGRIIHRTAENTQTDTWGVIPDVVVPLSDDEVRAIQESRRKVDQAFAPPTGRLDPPATSAEAGEPREAAQLEILRDRQLLKALSHLRHELDNQDHSHG
jgi:carboxyl-terminal processing protease